MSEITEPATAVSGQFTDNGRPHGFTSLTPFIVVDGASEAIAFYTEVFGARVTSRLDGPDGTVGHAELDFGTGRLQLSDPNDSFGLVAPDPQAAGVAQSIVVYTTDTDAVLARAEKLGATVVDQPSTFVSGDRFGAFRDRWGRRWSVMTRVEDLSPVESERRVAEWYATLGG